MPPLETQNRSDLDLLQAYQKGDARAFDELLQRHQHRVFYLVRQYFPQSQKAEEVFQEIWIKVLEKYSQFQQGSSFRAWLFTLCRNHCIDRLRYEKRRPETLESDLGSPDDEGFSLDRFATPEIASGNPEQQWSQAEFLDRFQEVLQKLPDEQRETFLLRSLGEYSFEEIAEQMNISVNTVKSRMRYALQQLKRLVKMSPEGHRLVL